MADMIEKVIEQMVNKSVDGVFHGSPRKIMENLSASSGTLYDKLDKVGIHREGRGRSAKWVIPQHIISKYKKG